MARPGNAIAAAALEGAVIKGYDNNNTAISACHKQYKKFMSTMQNAR